MISSGRCHGPGCTRTSAETTAEQLAEANAHLLAIYRAYFEVTRIRDQLRAQATGAASPRVASNPDPQVGWLTRLFDRLFGRMT